MRASSLLRILTAFGVLVAAAPALRAEIVQYNFNSTPSSYGTTASLVPITSTGGTSVSFVSKKAGLTAITFSAECEVYSSTPATNWLTIDIRIDGVAVDPTAGGDDAFCTQISNLNHWGTYSMTVAKGLAKGLHVLTVQAYVTGGIGRLDDLAVVVSR